MNKASFNDNLPILIYYIVLLMGIFIDLNVNSSNSTRDLASIHDDCNSMVLSILKPDDIKKPTKKLLVTIKSLDEKKDSIWSEINDPYEFRSFNNSKYNNYVEYYSNKNLINIENPKSLEAKLAMIEVISNDISDRYLVNPLEITNSINELSFKKIKKLNSLLKNFDPSSKLTQKSLMNFTQELFLILKGPNKSISSLLSGQEIFFNNRMMRAVQEEMLKNGIEGMIKKIPSKTNYSKKEQAELVLKKLFQYKILQLAAFLPYYLPKLKPIKISDELMTKVLLEGLDKHEAALKDIFRKQNMIDNYDVFRSIYTPIAYSIGIYVYYTVTTEKVIPYIKNKIDLNKTKKDLASIYQIAAKYHN